MNRAVGAPACSRLKAHEFLAVCQVDDCPPLCDRTPKADRRPALRFMAANWGSPPSGKLQTPASADSVGPLFPLVLLLILVLVLVLVLILILILIFVLVIEYRKGRG